MKLFTIVLTNQPDELAIRLMDAAAKTDYLLHNTDVKVSVRSLGNAKMLDVAGILPEFRLTSKVQKLYSEMAEVIAALLVDTAEELLIKQMIRKEYRYEQDELGRIWDYCKTMLGGEPGDEQAAQEAKRRRTGKIAAEIDSYLQEHTELIWEGMLRFRLKSYIEELRDIVAFAVDEYVMDRQYREFISLLQYFVYIQEAKVPAVHLVHKKGNEFELLDDQMNQLETDQEEAMVTVEMLDSDMNFEDMIVSTLISVSPKHIFIHTRDPEQQAIRTISQIFEDRVELCECCRYCQHLDHQHRAEYNKR